MGQVSLINGLQYGGYALELSLLILLLSPKHIKRFPALCAYVGALFGLDAVGRGWVVQHYGGSSMAPSTEAYRIYYYSYWLTDLVLALGMYLLVCAFFRQACQERPAWWEFIRPTLKWVLLLVIASSAVALKVNFHNLFSKFIYEFSQDLYFVCLVLNTALYLMLQHFKRGRDPLTLLVCGLGLQLAGQAGGSALLSLMPNQAASRMLMIYLSPFCFVGMMALWIFAIARGTPQTGVRDSDRSKAQGPGGDCPPDKGIPPAARRLNPSAARRRHPRLFAGSGALQAGYLKS